MTGRSQLQDKVIDRTHTHALGLNLRHLRAFTAVAAAGSIARAADPKAILWQASPEQRDQPIVRVG